MAARSWPHGDPEIAQLEEDAKQVRVISTVTNPGDGCADLIRVPLEVAFDARTLVDVQCGSDRARAVPVTLSQLLPAG